MKQCTDNHIAHRLTEYATGLVLQALHCLAGLIAKGRYCIDDRTGS